MWWLCRALYLVSSVRQHRFLSTENIKKLQGVYIADAVNVSLFTIVKKNESVAEQAHPFILNSSLSRLNSAPATALSWNRA